MGQQRRAVLVTGGNGFIGGYTCQELARQGYEPVVFDRRRDLAATTILGDIRDATAVTEAVAQCEAVVHLAGVLGTQETITNPLPAAETNVLGGLNVMQACAQYQVPLVNIGVGNWFEDNTYSLTKRCVERFGIMFAKYRGLRCCTVRAYNAYGPGQSVASPHGHSKVRKIMPSFISRALHGEPIQVYGDGSQVMDMVHVTDVAHVLVAALRDLLEGGAPASPWQAGTGRDTSVCQIAEAVAAEVARQLGSPAVKVERLPLRAGETPGVKVLANPGYLRLLKVDPEKFVTLEDGLVSTVGYYRKLFS